MPPFNDLGYLPPGVFEISRQQLMERFATNPRRLQLVTGLIAALRRLAMAGCTRAILGGSFISDKEIPGDFDGYFE
jgi:hypothetical protein